MRFLVRLSTLALLFCACFAAAAQDAYTPIEQRLTSGQLRATGLDGLDAEQLALLNALLRDEQSAQITAVREEAEKQDRGGFLDRDREPIVSRIAGPFQGWKTGTRFRLANGQTWRVIDTPEYYVPKSKAVDAPAVVIAPGLVGGFYMQVEGQGPRAKVQEVR